MSFQRSLLFRAVVLSFFVLLIIIIRNDIYRLQSSNSPLTTYTRFSDSPSRELSEFSYSRGRGNESNYDSREDQVAYKNMMRERYRMREECKRQSGNASRSYSMPYRITEEDVDMELSKKQLNKLINSFGPLIVEYDMYITFYHYHCYLQHNYRKLLIKLEKLAEKLGKRHYIPSEDLNELCMKCKKTIGKKMLNLNYYSYKYFFDFARDSPVEDTERFKIFLEDFVDVWKRKTQKIYKSLKQELTKDIKKYKRRSLLKWW
ncbi:hypothetical protein C922_02186 [Plasmodium inui San Antonio 1]|uniref:Plasmodium RESA N-terminal domain-containing protein n=1 Tax=Plasmodium inui San Antonio 1 TaxID=1237626 RepID=W7A6S0_9APIC|nr:hypothetical protein C922_02186 [Plasmodium inui San Antonio 1]EUD67480.1 hypothetical protein C922_02186 [Plasmodium inui San Antonio 1]